MRNKLHIDSLTVNGDYLLLADNTVLVAAYFDRAKVKMKAVAAMLGTKPMTFQYKSYVTKGQSYRTIFKPVVMGRDYFVYTTSVNKEVGERYLITTEAYLYEDFHDFLMHNYELPLIQEWMPKRFLI